MLDRGNQDTGCDSDRFGWILVLDLPAIWQPSISLDKYRYEIWSRFQKWLVFVRPQRGQCVQPLVWGSSLVKLPLLLLGRNSDLVLREWISNNNKVPGLKIGSARRSGCSSDALLNDLTRYRTIRELTHGAPLSHLFIEGKRALSHIINRVFLVACKENESW